MILLSVGTFLAYVIIAIFIILCAVGAYGWSKDIDAMKGVAPEKVDNFLDKIDDLQKKIDSIEKTLKQIENKNKENFEESEKESQSPE